MSSTSTTTATSSATPWVERYRPQSLDDISHQNEVIATLRNAVETNRLPHLLFYGPPGTGKTSVALALCRTLWHPSQWSQRVLELNASDERGISMVRDKIKQFASLAVGGDVSSSSTSSTFTNVASSTKMGDGNNKSSSLMKSFFKKTPSTAVEEDPSSTTNNNNKKEDVLSSSTSFLTTQQKDTTPSPKYPNPPYKIIILDESDTITPEAQAALRRIIEAYSKITRFILICNYVTRIIEPLASRCAKFRFQSLPPASMKNRLMDIAQKENCQFSIVEKNENEDEIMQEEEEEDGDKKKKNDYKNQVFDEILTLSKGDMRRAIQTLQSAHSLAGKGGVIVKESISEMMGLPPKNVLDSLLTLIRNPDLHFDDMILLVKEDILLEGHSAKYIIGLILERVMEMKENELSDIKKASIAIRIAEMDKLLVDGADEALQLISLCSFIQQCFKAV